MTRELAAVNRQGRIEGSDDAQRREVEEVTEALGWGTVEKKAGQESHR